MEIQFDHAFIGCQPGAPEAEILLKHGFVEGSRNVHPGQGTANRRFFFENFKLELIWINDPDEASGAQTRRLRLWERCTRAEGTENPFGIFLRPDRECPGAPFATWTYSPSYLPPGLGIEVAEGTTLEEPELFFLPFRRSAKPTTEPTRHRFPCQRLLSLSAGVRDPAGLSTAAVSLAKLGRLQYFPSDQPVLELRFEGPGALQLDLRPGLPLVFRTVG